MFSYSDLQLKKISRIADEIIDLDEKMSRMSDEDLRLSADYFKSLLYSGETLDDILVRAFAVCREATFRILQKKQYKVQLIGGIVLAQGRVAEMKTGEGKTLTELCPAYLNALSEKGVHIVTVNEYLSERDYEEMREVFEFLGLSVGLVLDATEDKKEEYAKDITYTTSTQIGFDYLNDNLANNLEDKVQRGLNYIIIDEVDSVLIDEAQTPLIIATATEEANSIYEKIIPIVRNFEEDEDYEYDRKESAINFTERGYEILENGLNIDLLDSNNIDILHYCNQSLRAEKAMFKDKDYIVDGNEVVIVDQNTGRLADGRRFSDGLHQALEAKEGLELKSESETLASITYPNLFNLYTKVSGMSGTVKTDEDEFREIYNLDVLVIPTNKPIIRDDREDIIVGSHRKKLKLIIKDIVETHKTGQPVLVCSQSINQSIEVSHILRACGIKHRLLNAYSKDEEAEIISHAGECGAITVSTNMAGRGTDIKVDDRAQEIGGLKVIGTERSLIRRVDNQLVGRAGRRGEAGVSQFYVSFEDELYEKFTTDALENFVLKYQGKEMLLEGNKFAKTVDSLQRFYYSMSYEGRKDNVKYDEVINKQREVIYGEREKLLNIKKGDKLDSLFIFIIDAITKKVSEIIDNNNKKATTVVLNGEMFDRISYTFNVPVRYFKKYFTILDRIVNKAPLINDLVNIIINDTNEILMYYEADEAKEYIINSILYAIDKNWVRELKELELDKLKVKNQTFNQKDPAIIFKFEALDSYNRMMKDVIDDFIDQWFYTVLHSMKYKLGEGFFNVRDEKQIS